MKDVKKLLKQQSSSILPDNNIKENIKTDLGINQQSVAGVAYNNGQTGSVANHNRTVVTMVALVLAILLIVGIVMFSVPSGVTNIGGKFDDIVTTDDFYAYGAASVGALIDSNSVSASKTADLAISNMATVVSLSDMSDPYKGNGSTLTEQQVQTVNGYMALVEELLGESKITHTGAVSTVEGYQYVMNIVYTDITGVAVNYTMYYNKTLTGVETEDDEQEETYDIDGILQIDGTDYPIEGQYKTETEEGESESEMRFRAYTSADRLSYIEVEQQNESEAEDNETEKEYVYTVWQNGRWTERTVAEYEQENNKISLVLTVTSADGNKNRLVFRNTSQNSQHSFAVSAWMDNSRIDFTVSIVEENGNSVYRYEYSDGSYDDCDRNDNKGWHGGDDDDDSDDEEDDDDDDDHDDRR